MKVILKSDVKGVGRKFDVKEVADGYGRNFLITRGLAEIATPGSMAKLEALRVKSAKEASERAERAGEFAKMLAGQTFAIKRKANPQGHLFESVDQGDIIRAITSSGVGEAQMIKLDLPEPIKLVGAHTIPAQIGDYKFVLNLNVEDEK